MHCEKEMKVPSSFLKGLCLLYWHAISILFAHVKTIKKLIFKIFVTDFFDICLMQNIVGGFVFINPVEFSEHACNISNLISYLLFQVFEDFSGVLYFTSVSSTLQHRDKSV